MSEELTAEDQLRLKVLFSQDVKAIRLDESNFILHALTGQGEASLPLHPDCRPDKYLRRVREALSGHVLGSPGGYPVYLSRWTRHGQLGSTHLGQLLLIGEPEAVVAVVHAAALTDELARYAWWAMPTLDNARLMLMRQAVADGDMGPVLVDFLIEHLPFLQEDHLAIMDTTATLLGCGALDAPQRAAIWHRGGQQNSYYVAFLEHCPDSLPASSAPHPAWASLTAGATTDPSAAWLGRALTGQGQAFIAAAIEILARPETQEVVNRTLNAIGRHFSSAMPADAEAAFLRYPEEIAALAQAAFTLATASEAMTLPVFSRSTAIGSLMRRRIAPITAPIVASLEALLARP